MGVCMHAFRYVGRCACIRGALRMAVRMLLRHGCARTAPLAAEDAPTHGPWAPLERIERMPFATVLHAMSYMDASTA